MKESNNNFCIPITFNSPLKTCFSNKKYMYITIQTQPSQIVISIFLNENPVFSGFFKIIVVLN